MLDLAGPWHVMSSVPGATCHTLWNRSGPIIADGGLELVTGTAFETAPAFDLLVIPGGPGQQSLMRHVPLMEFLRARAQTTRYLMAVGSGTLLLAQAGLLRGRRATTQASLGRSLGAFGATYVEEPYVIDGNVATCASAADAMELALLLVENLGGEQAAAAARAAIG